MSTSPRFTYAIEIIARRGTGQDRAQVFERTDGIVIALADGAGGTGNGAAAAQAVVDAAGAAGPNTDWCDLLANLDRAVASLGLCTAVILEVTTSGITGAGVGDSAAWLLTDREVVEVTAGQSRKPLVGDGCLPLRVDAPALAQDTLLIASDGLFRYAKRADIAGIVGDPDLQAAAGALTELVRLPSGELQDDVSIVLCRTKRADPR